MEIPQWLWACIGFIIGIMTAFLTRVILRAYEEYRDKAVKRTVARKDIKALISLFTETWEDRDFIKPHVKNFRKELVDKIMEIREKTLLLPTDFPPEIVDQLRKITNEFLLIANKEPEAGDDHWCNIFCNQIDNICIKLKSLAFKISK